MANGAQGYWPDTSGYEVDYPAPPTPLTDDQRLDAIIAEEGGGGSQEQFIRIGERAAKEFGLDYDDLVGGGLYGAIKGEGGVFRGDLETLRKKVRQGERKKIWANDATIRELNVGTYNTLSPADKDRYRLEVRKGGGAAHQFLENKRSEQALQTSKQKPITADMILPQNIGPFGPQAFTTSQSYQGLTGKGRALARAGAAAQKAVLNAIIYNPEEYDEKVRERDMLAASLGMNEAQMALLPRVDDRKDSPTYKQTIGDFSDAGWELKKLIDEQNLARRAAVENFELDLGGSFEGREKMIAAISLIIGSIGAGLTGGDNLAAKALDRHIERDIKRQMIKQKAKIQDLDLNHGQQKEMFMFAQKEQLQSYRRQVEKLALNTADLRLQDQYKVMLGGIDLQLANLMQVKTSSTQIPSSDLGGGKLSDAQKDASMISAVTVDLARTYEDVVAEGGGLSRWIGHFGKSQPWLLSLGRVTGLMDKHTSTYLNKGTMAVARIVKTLQGSRPSDFDWKKLETLIPGTRDDPELARADFQAIMDIAEVTATAELEFEKKFGGKSYGNNPQGDEERRRDYASSGAGRKLAEIGTRLDELDKRGKLDAGNAASVVNQWAYNLGAVENW